MKTKRIFLTGATGNVGRPVLAELLKRGYEVSALVRRRIPDVAGYRPVFGNLDNLEPVLAEVAGCDGIVHLGSPRGNARATVHGQDVAGTGDLLDVWNVGNFVYASSQTVYGIPRGPLAETAPLAPEVWYDLGKVFNEQQLAMNAAMDDAPGAAVSLRLALVFGAGERRNDRQFLPVLLEQARLGKRVLFDSEEGLETYGSSFIGETDAARAFVDALDMKTSGPFNLAGGFCTWRAVFEAIDRHAGTRTRFVVRVGARPEDGEFRVPQSRSYLDTTAFAASTGFSARESLDELVGKFIRREDTAPSDAS
jgi:nucleoside-diphosphate-sugar epimerase